MRTWRREDRRLHDLPRRRRRLLRRLHPRAGRRGRRARRAGARPARRAPTTRGARSTTAPSAAAPAWCCMPEPLFRCVEAVPDLPRPLYLLAPGGRRFDQARGRRAGGRRPRRVLAALRPLRGRGPAGGRPPGRRRALGGRLRAGRRGAGGARGGRGGGPAAARRARQRGLGARTRASPTGCSSTPSTPGRPSSGAGRCPRCCARATTARWPPGAAPRPCCARPSGGRTCIERLVRASALSASDVRALAEHGYDVPSGPSDD